jgi:hypothetical protein
MEVSISFLPALLWSLRESHRIRLRDLLQRLAGYIAFTVTYTPRDILWLIGTSTIIRLDSWTAHRVVVTSSLVYRSLA